MPPASVSAAASAPTAAPIKRIDAITSVNESNRDQRDTDRPAPTSMRSASGAVKLATQTRSGTSAMIVSGSARRRGTSGGKASRQFDVAGSSTYAETPTTRSAGTSAASSSSAPR